MCRAIKGTKARKQDVLRRKRGVRLSKATGGTAAPAASAPHQQQGGVPTGKVRQRGVGKGKQQADSSAPAPTHLEVAGGQEGSGWEAEGETEGSPGEEREEGEEGAELDSHNFNQDLEEFEQEQLQQAHAEHAEPHKAPLRGKQAQRAAQQAKRRPVVVAVVGEPNVGKSSTMNALLGAHKVRAGHY